MKNFEKALDKLVEGFEGFTEELRGIADDLPHDCGRAGDGEEPDGYDAGPRRAPDRGGVNDDTIVTLRSGDLREVLNGYRKLVRFAREGRIPTQDQRMKGHHAVRKVKHLVRKPVQ